MKKQKPSYDNHILSFLKKRNKQGHHNSIIKKEEKTIPVSTYFKIIIEGISDIEQQL